MPQYLLRIEGVNIYATVEDTNQLSVQRGSSLWLRQAVMETVSKKEYGLTRISTGASIGLFQFEAASNQDAVKIRDDIANDLNKDIKNEGYRYLTFVVDVVVIENDDFERAKEAVITLNRFRQFQQATLVFPRKNTGQVEPCAWDNLRPADGIKLSCVERENIGFAKISLSAGNRHNYGRDQKKEFIKQETATASGKNDGLDFDYTNDLHEIATPDADQSHLNSLKNKLAILYFDGNGFGGIQKNLDCKQLQDFDKTIQQKRKKWLRDLIETIQQDKDFKTTITKKDGTKLEAIRLEILLWGGDEFMLAVPAWKGMYVLQNFYQFHKDWTYSDEENKTEKHLTHAGGLVFCHVKTPIQRIKKLSQEIADHIKDKNLGDAKEGKIDKYTPDANLYDYVVLESIDYPTQTWQSFLVKRYKQAVAKKWKPQQPLYGAYENQAKALSRLKETLPRRQLYRLANAIINTDEEFANAYKQFSNVVDDADGVKKIAQQIFPDMNADLHWLHLQELWDYFAPPDAQSAKDSDRKEATS